MSKKNTSEGYNERLYSVLSPREYVKVSDKPSELSLRFPDLAFLGVRI